MKKIKLLTLLLILIVLIAALAVTANADEVISGKCGNNLTWEIKDHTLYIKGKGPMKNFAKGEAPWLAHKDKFHSLVIEEGVTSIGSYAFHRLTFDDYQGYIGVPSEIREASITFPSSLIDVGDNAFGIPCNSKIFIPSVRDWCEIIFASHSSNPLGSGGLYLIDDPDTQLLYIDIPEGIRNLHYTFCNYSDLKTVTVPKSVVNISDLTFSGNMELTAVFFEGDVPGFSYEANTENGREILYRDRIFNGTTTTCYYPENNETWTEDILLDYNGDITWVPYTPSDNFEFAVQPTNQLLFAGEFINIKAAATGAGLTYRWQLKQKGSDEWKNLENINIRYSALSKQIVQADSSELIIDPVLPEHEGKLRCIATNLLGEEITSIEVDINLKSTNCSDYATKLVEDTFRYLDEIYIKKYPELGLRNLYGTEEDQRQIKILSEAINENCKTDKEKLDMVFYWVKNNITYAEDASENPIDVLMNRKADCSGYATLQQALLREMGIPAVVGDGWRCDTNISKTETLLEIPGHAWCLAYVNGEWVLCDPLWENKVITDRKYMADRYYFEAINVCGWITPVYDDAPLPPGRNPKYYFDNSYWSYDENQKLSKVDHLGSGVYEFLPYKHSILDMENTLGWYYRDEEFTGYGNLKTYSNRSYIYYTEEYSSLNSVMLYRDGVCFLGNFDIFQPIESYITENGAIGVQTGFNGKLVYPSYFLEEGIDDLVYSWESNDTNVVVVSNDGNITALKEGFAIINVSISRPNFEGKMMNNSINIYVYDEPREPDFSNHAVAAHTHEYTEIIIPSTCVTRGTVICTCTYEGCTETYEKERLPLSGHNMCEWYVTKEATCEEEGEELSSCVKCDVTESRVISKLEHTYKKEVIAPTCTEEGYTVNTCTICGEISTSDTKEKIPHSFGEWKTLEVATKDKNGIEERACTDCGETEKRDIVYEETFFEKHGTVIIISSVSVFIIIAGAIIFIVVKKRR